MDLKELFDLNLCLRCTGRIFAAVDTGLTNEERGARLYFAYKSIYGERDVPESCYLCNGVFKKFDEFFNILMSKLNNYEFNSILVGSTFDENIIEMEKDIQSRFGSKGESIKKEFNREFGKYLSKRLGKPFSKDADLTIEVDALYENVNIIVKPVYIYGVYIKKSRDISQTRWIHKTGESIESIIGNELRSMTGCENYYLHGSGREDVDVMMLGNGREFVIEAAMPKRRYIDLYELQLRVNASGILFIYNLSYSSKATVRRIKSELHEKLYIAEVTGDLNKDIKKACSKFNNLIIEQRTPLRVINHRSDLVRRKKINYINIISIMNGRALLKICAEAGTYIKELVNGDNGRTVPSLSSVYGSQLQVSSLDVVKIYRDD
ncbi:tRNA pseudouridine(54/55) synthase Pus10 [Picrophilus oshimae]|uniref:tRNA pseudouridine synthase Pus10 n=2 Tax=Picrophilus torridus (strain ATCC 700027 / DSM 9790 / JCM 10055 / NBRC 100828 / KAW 2/3) TaxID=1122961 RepID=PUS10_PICTO|nr:tRNA pseudouridine(54/55) synthase Pus10 [Picrophilus oshimae]Q6L227.1 RecName: Full=tRNA pseudouridine synthase Pus10; AltName: Full=tRNA pseudouridine 54/55 synthase; Short=Psi54/55 synthase [Picrophilus oshimae DSM 9789]AAT42975.1 hypothetical conserved protein [Picrophilus oshimae DSM 9789]SMD30723.1 tRNA pseudouridine synthase 10 [Picrophilus oshimae DSM 9789]